MTNKILVDAADTPLGVSIAQLFESPWSGTVLGARSKCCAAQINWNAGVWNCSSCQEETGHSPVSIRSSSSIENADSGGVTEWVSDWTGIPEDDIRVEVLG